MKTMKFIVKLTAEGGERIGSISSIPRLPGFAFETPNIMLYTKGAAVPHLTDETLSMVTKHPQILEFCLPTTLHMEPAIARQGSGLAEFSSTNGHLSYVSFMDPLNEDPSGHFETNYVPLWTKMGKKMVNASRYMDIIEAFKPDMYHAICDGSTDVTATKKRLIKASDRTRAMFEVCLKRHSESEYLSSNSSLLGVISGSHSKQDRQRCLTVLLDSSEKIGGFVLEGLTKGGPKTRRKDFTEFQEIIEDVTPQLPQDKIRLLHGCWNPVVVLEAVASGWDVFDSTYPTNCAEMGHGLIFSFTDSGQSDSHVDLKDSRYKEDLTPILEGCECLCCKKHTRAYINHLLNTREMLAEVLLMMHNLHHYMKFFAAIRRNIQDNTLNELKKIVSKQYEQHLTDESLTPPSVSPTLPGKRRLLAS